MRQSIFLLPTDMASRVFAATRIPREKLAGRLKNLGLDEATYQRLTPVALEAAYTPVKPSELPVRAPGADNLYPVLRLLAREGLVLRVGASLRMDQLKYVATEAWLGKRLDEINPDEALTWLAGEYLRGLGPGRVADFAWWSGAGRRAAALALGRVPTVDIGGGLLLREEDLDEFQRVEPVAPGEISILPKWDSYTMGHAPDGRQRLIDDQYLTRAFTSVAGSPGATAGDGLPLLLRGGRAVASWAHRFDGNRMSVTVSPFVEGDQLPESAFDAIGQLLSASSLEVTTEGQNPARAASALPRSGPAR
jgi:hypothetical protein